MKISDSSILESANLNSNSIGSNIIFEYQETLPKGESDPQTVAPL